MDLFGILVRVNLNVMNHAIFGLCELYMQKKAY